MASGYQMNTAREYLEIMQGLMVFFQIKRNMSVSLQKLGSLDETSFNNLVEEFLLVRGELLELQEKMEDKIQSELREELRVQDEKSDLVDRMYQRELPSRFQQRTPYQLLLSLYNELRKSCETLKLPTPPANLILATLPTGKVNAVAIRHRASGEYIIAFESMILDFVYEFVKVISLSMPYSMVKENIQFSADNESVKKHLETHPEVQLAFDVLIWNYINGKDIKNRGIELKTDAEKSFCAFIVYPAEIYIMGHEYGHILCGHHEKSTNTQQLNLDAEEINQAWVDEYEADRVGLVISIQSVFNAKFQIDYSLIGATVYFILKEFVDKAISIADYGHENDTTIYDSHPPATKRIENMKTEFLKHFSEEQLKIAEVLPRTITNVTNVLWERTKPLLYSHYKRKAGIVK